jgi:DNA adenine methylase
MQQLLAFEHAGSNGVRPFRTQFLKWIGNKQRFAHEIVGCFPSNYGTYIEPFLGSAAVLGTLAPNNAIGSDICRPLVELWQALRRDPKTVKHWYAERWNSLRGVDKQVVYERVKASFNDNPNPADLLFLCRSCYGGVVRFRKADGYMSTPCGAHTPIAPESFARRADEWSKRCRNAEFIHADYRESMSRSRRNDLIYCDPPYVDSQAILYGAQSFSLANLLDAIAECKARGVFIALSIDGTKRSGDKICDVPIPDGLFEQEILVNCGRSMLRRFQMAGQTLEGEVVADRLLLTYRIEDHN